MERGRGAYGDLFTQAKPTLYNVATKRRRTIAIAAFGQGPVDVVDPDVRATCRPGQPSSQGPVELDRIQMVLP